MRPRHSSADRNATGENVEAFEPCRPSSLRKALTKVRAGPRPRPRFSSRTADKFVIRGYVELFEELKGIGLHQGRSMNSEAVAAILDSLEGNLRSTARVRVLQAHLGRRLSAEVMAEVGNSTSPFVQSPRSLWFVFRPALGISFVMASRR